MMQTLTELAEELNCRKQSITQYMGRSEFSHINKIWLHHHCYFEITENEKRLLKLFIDRGRIRNKIIQK